MTEYRTEIPGLANAGNGSDRPSGRPHRSVSLKRNLAANFIGQGLHALMNLAFVPVYIRLMGIEAYGLIGIFGLLQSCLSLIDMGMKPALGREMARFSAGAHTSQSIRDLLRSVEVIAVPIAGGFAVCVWAASDWIAGYWVTARALPVGSVADAFTIMAAVTSLRFIENIYLSSIAGLQRQVLQNVVTGLMATTRGLGAVAVLVWISPTIRAFFIWQGLVSLLTVALFALIIYRTLPQAPRPGRFSLHALIGIRRFAAGMVAITCLAFVVSQADKLLLSRLLPLTAYGYYALAASVVNALYMFAIPVTAAFYPRLTKLVTEGNEDALRSAYHEGAQLVTVLMGSAAVVLFAFGHDAILLWTRDPVIVREAAPLVAVLSLGTLLNGLMHIPYQTMLAYGWTTLRIRVDSVAVCLLVPAILLIVPRSGAISAAWIWVTLNAGYVTFTIYLMHRRILKGEKWRWYWQDVFLPLAAASGTALFFRIVIPAHLGRIHELGALCLAATCVLLTASVAARRVRNRIAARLPRKLHSLFDPVGRFLGHLWPEESGTL